MSSSVSSSNSVSSHSGIPEFDYDPRTRVVFGAGTLERLGELARQCGGQRVLLVTDHGLRTAGHADRALIILKEAGLEVTLYDDVHQDPTTEDVERGLAVAREAKIDLIVGLGGGSSMDTAKGINFLLTNGGKMEDYWGTGKAKLPMLPMIAVPTTAGTGSEGQSYALIARPDTHMKMACGDKKAACRVAVLDPDLTISMPPSVTAATGIDAISHALESYVTTRRNPVSQLFSREAWRLLSQAFPRVLANPHDREARGAMLLGAHLAGAAIENSMLGATHACANPLSAHYSAIHGVAIGVMLPHVVRFNAQALTKDYALLAQWAGLGEADDPHSPELLASSLTEWVRQAGQPTQLRELGVATDLIPTLSQEAAKQWTAQFNPRPVREPEFQELYRCAW